MASELEPNNSISTANTVVAGQAISGQANGEADYYKLLVPASSSGLLYASINSSSSASSWSVSLLNAAGVGIGSAYLSNGQKLGVKLPGPGTYYAYVYGSYNQANYDLTLSSAALSSTQENEPNDSATQADSVVASQAIKARLSDGSDYDYFKLSTAAAGMVSIKFEAPVGNYSTYYLSATNVSGTNLGSWSTKASASYSFNTPAAGDYYVSVSGAYSGVYDSDYSLTLAQSGANAAYELEPNNSISTANTVVAGQAISGQANGESDYYKLLVPASSSGLLYASINSSSSASSWSVSLLNAAGVGIGSAYLSNGQKLGVKLPGPGTYYAYVYGSYNQANYDLTLSSAALSSTQENEPNDSATQADSVVASQAIKARLSDGSDYDYFKLSTAAAGMVSIKFEAPVGNYSTYYLSATNVSGTNLGSWSTKASASYSFNTPAAGDYYVSVSGAYSGVYDSDYSLTLAGLTSPTYNLNATGGSVNEGSIATFTLTTTNLPAGTSVVYTISGIGITNGDLVSSQLTGTAVIDSSGKATISIAIAADQATEGAETLIIGAQGASASILINDTSVATVLAPAFSLVGPSSSVNEGSSAVFSLTTSNVASGTSVAYTLSGAGITTGDISSGQLSGTVILDASGKATITILIAADLTTEGPETLTVTAQGARASVQINDTSVLLVPTYVLSAASPSVNEGSSAVFSLSTGNVAGGTSVSYTLSGLGITSGDISGGQLSGSVVVDVGGNARISVPIAADGITEGPETLILTLGGKSTSIVINDVGVVKTGTAGPDFLVNSLGSDTIDGGAGVDTVFYSSNQSACTITRGVGSWTVSSLAEGVDALSNVERLHFADLSLALDLGVTQASGRAAVLLGAVLPGKLALDPSKQSLMGTVIGLFDAGYSLTDLAGALLRLDIWTILTGSNTKQSIANYLLSNVNGVAPDAATLAFGVSVLTGEPVQGTWLAALAGGSAGQSHIGLSALAQTGLAYIAPESVGAVFTNVDEGGSFTFFANTNFPFGTSLPYTLTGTGITTEDIVGGALSGTAVVNAFGQATVVGGIVADNLTEGPETLIFTSRGLTASVLINDTSQTPLPVIALASQGASVNEGAFANFTLTTTNVSPGTIYQYTLSGIGITASDFGGGQLTGSIAINAAGAATISIPIAADFLTEGPETLILTVAGKTASVVINDTAVAPVATYRLTAVGSSVNEGSTATFTLTTTYVPVGTSLPYTISGLGIDSGDIYGGQLSGTLVITQNGTAVISVPTLADVSTEGAETLIVTVAGNSAQIVINDTSRGAPSYQLFPSALAVNVGDTLVVTLKTTNLAPGTPVPYILKGVPSTDIVGGLLSGDVVVDTSGVANINIAIAQHQTTDILTINVADQNVQVTLVGIKGG